MTDIAAPKPDWIPTTIEELQRRLARGEWPRVRAISDKPGPFQLIQGRLTAFDGRCGTVLAEPGFEGTAADLTERSTTVWVVSEPDATEAVLDAFDDLTEMRAATVDEWTEHVARWSEPMAAKLRANAHKDGWLYDAPAVLLERVYDELEELGQSLATAIKSAREGLTFTRERVAALRNDAADVANMVMMVADATEHQERQISLHRWRVPEVRRRADPVRIAIGPYLIHEQRGPDGTSGLTIRKNNEVGSDPVFEIEASGTGNWRHSAYPAVNGAPVAAKPIHRAVTLTAETLGLARLVARYLIEWTHRTTPDPIEQDTATAKRLLAELVHAEGMPAADLRKLCKWARETTNTCTEAGSDWLVDPSVVEIVDRILMHLAIDEMPAGSVEVRGSTVEVSGGTHRRELGFAVDTAEIRAAIKANAAKNCRTIHAENVEPLLAEIDSLRDRVSISRTSQRRLAVLLDLVGSEPPFPEIVASVERLVERADEQADTLKLIADEFAGLVDPANPLLEVRALAERSRKIDASLGLLFGMPIQGRSLNAEELIEAARKMAGSKIFDTSARVHLHSLSDALRKIDRISHGVDPAEAMAPVITAAMADVLVVRIGRQFDGFRQLGERTMTAAAELAACEALIHRGFDRLREVDPEFVESLRKGGS